MFSEMSDALVWSGNTPRLDKTLNSLVGIFRKTATPSAGSVQSVVFDAIAKTLNATKTEIDEPQIDDVTERIY
jgi:hypothetical protein